MRWRRDLPAGTLTRDADAALEAVARIPPKTQHAIVNLFPASFMGQICAFEAAQDNARGLTAARLFLTGQGSRNEEFAVTSPGVRYGPLGR